MTVGEQAIAAEEIEATFERLGLASEMQRQPFLLPSQSRELIFDVVISTTSQPYDR